MPATTQGARSRVCERCHGKYTLVLTVEYRGDDKTVNLAPVTCPKCGHQSMVTTTPGQRIVNVAAIPYADLLGR